MDDTLDLVKQSELPLTRRRFLHAAGAFGALAGLQKLSPAFARSARDHSLRLPARQIIGQGGLVAPATVNLTIEHTPFGFAGRRAIATTVNGTIPGPLLRFREGERASILVTNRLKETTSVHWHGLLVPNAMDGVPGVTYEGIHPGQNFHYEFPLQQSGTYWYHSHSGFQEQLGHYGPLIIDPIEPEPFRYDREYVVMLSDWSYENPVNVLDNIKKQSTYYNFQQRTVGDFFRDAARVGLRATIADRKMWGQMRMSPTDIADVTGSTYTYLMNGLPSAANWTALFRPGERVRLRIINAGAGSFFDVRIPGLEMTVIQASGQNVQPVVTDEIRIEIAQTYDVIVQPKDDRAYTIFAESMDRSGFARGTLAPRAGMSAPIPPRRPRPTLTMMDMGMSMSMGGHAGMSMSGPEMSESGASGAARTDTRMSSADMAGDAGKSTLPTTSAKPPMAAHDMAAMSVPATADASRGFQGVLRDGTIIRATNLRAPGTIPEPEMHSGSSHGAASAGTAMETRSRLHEPGAGLGEDGWRVLVYTDLKRLTPATVFEPPAREVELHLTGNMERYMWSVNGVKFSDAHEPIRLTHGERIRLTMVNDTMMPHPMHLHGVFMELENGHGAECPLIHTINVKPAERVSLLVTPMHAGAWAFHCHILLHMDLGMFRVFQVSEPGGTLKMSGGTDE
jgi:CopA family copper-resistance protein